MDEFVNTLDDHLFSATNTLWNRLHLNSIWSVGCVSELIQSKEWKNKEEWENFYFKSGEARLPLLGNDAEQLNNFHLDRFAVYKQPQRLKDINFNHGRTQAELQQRAAALFEAIKKYPRHLSLEQCYEAVRFRTICETWNGIIIGEEKSIELLHNLYPNLSFDKVDGFTDYTYAVDYEVKRAGSLIAAIQIKPQSYYRQTPYLQDARKINTQKNNEYKRLTGVDVLNVVYEKKEIEKNQPKVYTLSNVNEITNFLNHLI